MKEKFLRIYQTYFKRKMLALMALGFASGFPFLLIFSTLSMWLKDAGLKYAAIGAFSLVKIPYTFKWLWSPLVDQVKIPLLSKMGRRRSWALVVQILLFGAIFLLSVSKPETNLALTVVAAVLISLFSATLDIVLDALRVEFFYEEPDSQASGAAIFVLGYRFGILFSGAGALALASVLTWNTVYFIMSLGTAIGILTILMIKEPQIVCVKKEQHKENFKQFIKKIVLEPFKNFMKRKEWKLILFFIFIYRLGDSYVGPMAFPFYDDMGFTKLEIAYVIKIYGMIATIVGGLYGGLLLKQVGLYKGLYICVWAQGLTTLFYSILALCGHNVYMLIFTISIENFASGMATTAFVAYLSGLCDLQYTASQYALLSSFMSFSRDVFASTSGVLKNFVPWPVFFAIGALFAVPAGIITLKLAKKE